MGVELQGGEGVMKIENIANKDGLKRNQMAANIYRDGNKDKP